MASPVPRLSEYRYGLILRLSRHALRAGEPAPRPGVKARSECRANEERLADANPARGEMIPGEQLVRRRVPHGGDAAERVATANGVVLRLPPSRFCGLAGFLDLSHLTAAQRGERHRAVAPRGHRSDEKVRRCGRRRRNAEPDLLLLRPDPD